MFSVQPVGLETLFSEAVVDASWTKFMARLMVVSKPSRYFVNRGIRPATTDMVEEQARRSFGRNNIGLFGMFIDPDL
jgi:hypothetical protein